MKCILTGQLTEKEELWRRINRTIDIDPWRLVPVPGKSTIFTVLADQAASDMSYMSPLDIAKAAGIILLIVALIGGGAFGAYYFLFRGSARGVEAMEEIFLDERSYNAYNEESRVRVTDEEINDLIKDAFDGLEDEGGLTKHSAVNHNSAKEPVYTSDEMINDKLKTILDGIDGIAFVNFTERDVVRHELVKRIIKAYEKYEEKEIKK